jgi:hypothetical protein
MSINHITTNLITKGLLNISNITKGFILVNYEIVFKKKGGGSSVHIPLHYEKNTLFDEIRKHKEDDIDLIKVYVNWNTTKNNETIKVELIKKQIEAEILLETTKKIKVEIID